MVYVNLVFSDVSRLRGCFFYDSNFMRTECMKSKMMYDRPMPGSRLVSLIGDSKSYNQCYRMIHCLFFQPFFFSLGSEWD
jgi:hypothetical protein